jgi:hypothetical protein
MVASVRDPMWGDRIHLALSGGGHRATLFDLGVLLAFVDIGINKRVAQIASVSGGSITNAVVATSCEFSSVEPSEFWAIAERIVKRTRRGVLNTIHIAFVFGALLLLGVGTAVLIGRLLGSAYGVLIAVIVIASIALMRGLVIEVLISAGYLNSVRGPRLQDLPSTGVEHVWCCTDLVSGVPVYVSNYDGGVLWRRTESQKSGVGLTLRAKHLRLSSVVRASAGFPGIPPKRLRYGYGHHDLNSLETISPFTMFLVDGGVWNNLGSHVTREDCWESGTVRHAYFRNGQTLVMADASASTEAMVSPMRLYLPLIAEAYSLLRSMLILNANTVEPRRDAIRTRLQHRFLEWRGPSPRGDPLDIMVPINELPGNLIRTLFELDRSPVARKLPEGLRYMHSRWAGELAAKIVNWASAVDPNSPSGSQLASLADMVTQAVDARPDYNLSVIVESASLEALRTQPWFKEIEKLALELPNVPTTLSAIPQQTALALVARGYANAIVCSLMIRPLDPGVTGTLEKAPARLRALCGDDRQPTERRTVSAGALLI